MAESGPTPGYIVPDSELQGWELRIRRCAERHPSLVERIDKAAESDEAPPIFTAAVLWLMVAAPMLLLGVVFLVLTMFHPEVVGFAGCTIAFLIAGGVMTLACYVGYREDKSKERRSG